MKVEAAMFERFTREACQVVIDAQEECRRLQGPRISPVHLLLALTRDGHDLTTLLARYGLDPETIDEHASDALTRCGLDAEAVRAWRKRLARGPVNRAPSDRARRRSGHLPFRADAKICLEVSRREAGRLGASRIGAEHLALGMLRDPGPLLRPMLVALDVDVPALRRDLELLRRPAA
jgi:ATP-dependent Clp protease ATP-binding subunit ClpA